MSPSTPIDDIRLLLSALQAPFAGVQARETGGAQPQLLRRDQETDAAPAWAHVPSDPRSPLLMSMWNTVYVEK